MPTERGTVDHPNAPIHHHHLHHHPPLQAKPDEASQSPPFTCSELPLAFQDPLEKRKGAQGEDGIIVTVMGDCLLQNTHLWERREMPSGCCGPALSNSEPPEPKPDQENRAVFSLLHSLAESRALGALFAFLKSKDEAFPACAGPSFAGSVTNEHQTPPGSGFPCLPCLPTRLMSLMSQVITSGELICSSTRAAWYQPKPWRKLPHG